MDVVKTGTTVGSTHGLRSCSGQYEVPSLVTALPPSPQLRASISLTSDTLVKLDGCLRRLAFLFAVSSNESRAVTDRLGWRDGGSQSSSTDNGLVHRFGIERLTFGRGDGSDGSQLEIEEAVALGPPPGLSRGRGRGYVFSI